MSGIHEQSQGCRKTYLELKFLLFVLILDNFVIRMVLGLHVWRLWPCVQSNQRCVQGPSPLKPLVALPGMNALALGQDSVPLFSAHAVDECFAAPCTALYLPWRMLKVSEIKKVVEAGDRDREMEKTEDSGVSQKSSRIQV